MSKDDYIRLISKCSNQYGDKLVELMELCHVNNLQSVPTERAKDYYERMCDHAVAG